MTNLVHIDSVNNVDVVDSRLIAIELGIKHKTFLETIRKYEAELQAFGQLPFETETVTNSVGAKNQVIFVYLNEEQATFVMTLSRNTKKVVNCKMKLVKSFSQAKQIIVSQNDRIRELELELQLQESKERTEQLKSINFDKRVMLTQTAPEPVQQKILGYEVVKEVVEKEVVVDKRTGERYDGVGIGYIAKRYGFKTNKQAWAYLESIGLGKDSEHWKTELSAVTHKKLERSLIDYIDKVYYDSDRQLFLGE